MPHTNCASACLGAIWNSSPEPLFPKTTPQQPSSTKQLPPYALKLTLHCSLEAEAEATSVSDPGPGRRKVIFTSHSSTPCTASDKPPSSWGWQGGPAVRALPTPKPGHERWVRAAGAGLPNPGPGHPLPSPPQLSQHSKVAGCTPGSAAPSSRGSVTSGHLWRMSSPGPCTPARPRRSPGWAGGQQSPSRTGAG